MMKFAANIKVFIDKIHYKEPETPLGNILSVISVRSVVKKCIGIQIFL